MSPSPARPPPHSRGDQDGHLLDVTVAATARDVGALRRRFRRWVDDFVAADVADDLTLAVYEALANVVEHAYQANEDAAVVRLIGWSSDEHLVVRVVDQGRWLPPGDTGYRGRGLQLIGELVPDAHLDTTSEGTTVVLRAPLVGS